MKLLSISSNQPKIFPSISFRNGINVIVAKITDRTRSDRDSHNLGKTFLISVIDFALLSTVRQEHPFRVHKDRFEGFVFFLDILTNQGQRLTIRRPVRPARNKAVSLNIRKYLATESYDPPKDDAVGNWTYPGLGIKEAKKKVNEFLGLEALQDYGFRKGLAYVLRQQGGYQDVFRAERFARGRDKNWKPYTAMILGFDPSELLEKYEKEDEKADLEKLRRKFEELARSKAANYDDIRGQIELEEREVEKLRRSVDHFSFGKLEASISKSATEDIEVEVSRKNKRRYVIDLELQELSRTLQLELAFDLERIKRVFSESRIALSAPILRSYEELLEFNRRLSVGRKKRLSELKKRLQQENKQLVIDLAELDRRRVDAIRVLEEKETLKKYQRLQRRLIERERKASMLRARLEALDHVSAIQGQIDDVERSINRAAYALRESIRSDIPTYSRIRHAFSDYVSAVLSTKALLSVTLNQRNNFEFHVRTLDNEHDDTETSEGRGTSYKKLLCACFDLAVIGAHSGNSFYRFVYHDGILEGLDDRKKNNLLDLIRKLVAEHDLQYILTVLDSDLPRDEHDQTIGFREGEVIRELHDKDDSGRLFQMPPF